MNNFHYSLITASIFLLVISSSIIYITMKPSSISFFLPLRLLILFLLSVSSLAHTPPAQDENQCQCPCPCHEATSPPAHDKNHEATSPPAQNKGQETTSPPAQNKGNEGSTVTPPAQNKGQETTSPPAQNKGSEGSTSPPPAQNKSQETTSLPQNNGQETTSPPAQNKGSEGSTSPPPAQNKSQETTSPPAQNKGNESSAVTPPAQNKGQETTSPPAQNKGYESSAVIPPAQNKGQETTSPPQNNGQETTSPPTQKKGGSTSPPPAKNKNKGNEDFNSPPLAQNKSDETSSPPAQNKSDEVTSPPAQNKGQEGSTLSSSFKGFFSQVFAFGESYTDRGNAFLLEKNASSANQQNQFCDGHLLVDFLCDALALPTLPPYKASVNFTFGINFAIAGSTSLPSSFFSKLKAGLSFWKGMPMETFQTQIDWFNKFRSQMGCKDENSCKAKMSNALFWIGEMGIDDYIRTNGFTFSRKWIAENSVASVARILQTLLESGARYIVVQGLPPIGCLPVDITTCPLHSRDHLGCAPVANGAIKIHNIILQRELKRFQDLHPDCSILYADYWSAYMTILENPAKYNFEEPLKACCGASGDLNFNIDSPCGSPGTTKCKDPSKYISWDGIHLTQAMHKHIANLFINQGFCQPSFASLIQHKSTKN